MEYNTFAAGLVTEVNEINNPGEIIRELVNYEIQRDGSAYLRPPMRDESVTMFTHESATSAQRRLRTFTWPSPDGSSSVDIILVQYGETFRLYTRNKSSGAVTNITPAQNALSHLTGKGAASSAFAPQYTAGPPVTQISDLYMASMGKWAVITGLEITTGGTAYKDMVMVLEYNSSDGTLNAWYDWLWTRDFFGVEITANDDSKRVTAGNLTARQAYNLFNRGWWQRATTGFFTAASNRYFVREFLAAQGVYPSVSDLYSIGVARDSIGTIFTSTWVTDAPDVAGPAPQGHYIIPFTRRSVTSLNSVSIGRGVFSDDFGTVFSSLSGATAPTSAEASGYSATLPTDRSGRPNACGVYAGRFWYSFTNRLALNDPASGSPDIQTVIAFSQIMTSRRNAVQCYQKNDPTSAEISDVLADDGGYVILSGCAEVRSIMPLGESLVVLASNGVWRIGPPTGETFSATGYVAERISYIGCVHDMSVVPVGNAILYWSNTGIEAVARNELGLSSQNVSDSVIKTYLLDNVTKYQEVVGCYDNIRNRARWLIDYTDGVYTKELVYDATLKSFSTNEYEVGTTRFLLGYTQLPADSTYKFTGTTVQKSNFLFVQKDASRVLSHAELRYDDADGSTYSWEDVDGAYTGSMKLSHISGGETQRQKRPVYLTVHCLRTEDEYTVDANGDVTMNHESSCLVDVFWDFADSDTSSLKAAQFEAYRYRRLPLLSGTPGTYTFDYGQSVLTTKNKLRGHGRALQLKFSSTANKDCRILGWASDIKSQPNP